MLTIHRARAVLLEHDGVPGARGLSGGAGQAVVVSGDRFVAIGSAEELLAEYEDRARVRAWDGVLTPGRYEPDGAALLESAYWPDPRESADLGTEPLTGTALDALEMTDARWGASARRGVQRLLAAGTTAISGPFARPPVRRAVERSGIRVLPAPRRRELATGGLADFAVFAEDGSCLVTSLGGRLLHRRR